MAAPVVYRLPSNPNVQSDRALEAEFDELRERLQTLVYQRWSSPLTKEIEALNARLQAMMNAQRRPEQDNDNLRAAAVRVRDVDDDAAL